MVRKNGSEPNCGSGPFLVDGSVKVLAVIIDVKECNSVLYHCFRSIKKMLRRTSLDFAPGKRGGCLP